MTRPHVSHVHILIKLFMSSNNKLMSAKINHGGWLSRAGAENAKFFLHLPIHLVLEAQLCGPHNNLWMYYFEWFIGDLKGKSKNKTYLKGSIVESYLVDGQSEFDSMLNVWFSLSLSSLYAMMKLQLWRS